MRQIWPTRMNIILVLIFSSATISCIKHHIKLEPSYIGSELLPKVKTKYSINLVNSQKNEGEILLCNLMIGHEKFVDLHQFCDTAILVFADALKRNNVQTDEKSDKIIKFSIIKASCYDSAIFFNFDVTLQLETSGGKTKRYDGAQSVQNVYSAAWAFERAVTNSVMEALKDPEIISYLSN